MMDWYGNGMGTGGWVAMIAMMMIFWGLVILAGVLIFRGSSHRRNDAGTQHASALEILDDRFARGEVDPEEYEARKVRSAGKRTLTRDPSTRWP